MALVACVDGLNLSLATGSGIATYGRGLLKGIDAVGGRSQVLFGPRGRLSHDALINQISLVDGTRASSSPSRLERHLLSARAPFGLKVTAVPRTHNIIWPNDGASPVSAQDYWISQDIFRTSTRSFRRFGKFSRAKFSKNNDSPVPNVMHWTSPLPIIADGALNIYTIHDLIPLKLPFSTLDEKQEFLSIIQQIVRVADHILVVSETTKNDLIELVGADPEKITNTYQSVEFAASLRTQSETEKFLQEAFGLKWREYYLHYGAIEPKKNLARVVEAYIQSGVQTPLVIAGPRDG